MEISDAVAQIAAFVTGLFSGVLITVLLTGWRP